ncbi:MAG: hypothetical protein ACLP7Q_16500 [Isosphaeraceae bacterium]
MTESQGEWREDFCPLCKGKAHIGTVKRGDQDRFRCSRCGDYSIGGSFRATLQVENAPRWKLSGVTRDATERGVELPTLTDLNAQEMEELVPSSVGAKARHLLQWLGRRAKFPGDSTRIYRSFDYPLVYGRNDEELWFFLTHLHEAGLIDHQEGSVCTP